MATKIVTKNSSTASAVPTASDLVQGELAVNVADKRLFTENNAGAIVELGTNPSALTVTGEITANGGIALGDNDKATFGAGDDLQIYHDGEHSYVSDTGIGYLKLKGSNYVQIMDASNAVMANFESGGAVYLSHNGADRFSTTSTGIDVTGTVTSTGILEASDGTTGEMQLGLGTALTTGAGTYDSTVRWNGSSGNLLFSQGAVEKMRIGNSGIDVTGTATMDGLVTQAAANTYPAGAAQIKSLAGDISYITNVGGNFLISNSSTTDQFVLSSAGRVGIGTSSPDNKLTIGDSSTVSVGKQWGMDFQDAAKGEPQAYIYAEGRYDANFNTDLTFGTIGLSGSATERLRIDSSGDLIKVGGVIKGERGTAAAPAYSFSDDTDTGMFNISNLHLGFSVGGTERMRIDSAGSTIIRSGNKLILNRTDNAIGGEMSYVAGTGFIFNDANGDGVSFNQGVANKVRIDSAGNLLVGGTSASQVTKLALLNGSATTALLALECTHTTPYGAVQFVNGNGTAGSISVYSTSVAYNTSSDYRLKENIADADDAGSKIDAIQVRQYDWKADGSHQDYGMVAQELQAVAPEAVSGDADSEDMMGVDYSKLVPMLIKEIQSLRNRVAQLEE